VCKHIKKLKKLLQNQMDCTEAIQKVPWNDPHHRSQKPLPLVLPTCFPIFSTSHSIHADINTDNHITITCCGLQRNIGQWELEENNQ
jgi:hypothetical protein